MKVLILGAYGMLGHKMFQQLSKKFEVFGTCRKIEEKFSGFVPSDRLIEAVDAKNIESVYEAIEKVKPDVVLNCIGIITQKKTGDFDALNLELNAVFPQKIAMFCQHKNIRFLHFSTDCVFSGKKGNYLETDIPDAEDVYGKTKFLGEVSGENCLTIRTSILGPELDSRVSLLEWFLSQKGKKVKGFSKALFSGFPTVVLANVVEQILLKYPNLSGLYHVASAPISKYDLLSLIRDTMKLNIDIEASDEHSVNKSLNASLFQKSTGISPLPWDAMIDILVEDYFAYSYPSQNV